MEEALKSLKIAPKLLARVSRAKWEILLGSEEEAKSLAGNTLTTRSLRLQTEYLGTRKTKITVHGVPADISDDRMGSFFSKFGQVEEVSAIMGKTGIATGDMVLQVILNRPAFECIPNLLKC